MPVTGIGGLFFRSADPAALSAWYNEHLGVGGMPWEQSAGPTMFQPFAADTDYFAADKQWMLNLRVSDLDGLLAALAASGIAITRNDEWDSQGFGRFARIQDPEGHAIELWEPAEDAA